MKRDVIAMFSNLKVWQRGDQRAPHKPLLLLLYLGRYAAGKPRLIPYTEIDKPLRELLELFGPARKSFHSEYPFWRLQNDGVWELTNAAHVTKRSGQTDAKKSELIRFGVSGGLTEDVFTTLQKDRPLQRQVVSVLLEKSFPDSLHQDILEAVGLLDSIENSHRRKRDRTFREMVLRAYEYRCAICGLDLRMAGRELGLEAAHIKWHQARGPDVVENGLSLCSLHHKLFDRGAIGLSDQHLLLVSDSVHGTEGMGNWLLTHQGKPIRKPQRTEYSPSIHFVEWHRKEVFRSPPRAIMS